MQPSPQQQVLPNKPDEALPKHAVPRLQQHMVMRVSESGGSGPAQCFTHAVVARGHRRAAGSGAPAPSVFSTDFNWSAWVPGANSPSGEGPLPPPSPTLRASMQQQPLQSASVPQQPSQPAAGPGGLKGALTQAIIPNSAAAGQPSQLTGAGLVPQTTAAPATATTLPQQNGGNRAPAAADSGSLGGRLDSPSNPTGFVGAVAGAQPQQAVPTMQTQQQPAGDPSAPAPAVAAATAEPAQQASAPATAATDAAQPASFAAGLGPSSATLNVALSPAQPANPATSLLSAAQPDPNPSAAAPANTSGATAAVDASPAVEDMFDFSIPMEEPLPLEGDAAAESMAEQQQQAPDAADVFLNDKPAD